MNNNHSKYVLGLAVFALSFALSYGLSVNFIKHISAVDSGTQTAQAGGHQHSEQKGSDTCANTSYYQLGTIIHPTDSPERFPDIGACPTTRSAKSGPWNDASTWGGRVPSSDDIAVITPGTTVTLSGNASVKAVAVKGSLVFDESRDVDIKVGTIMVYDPGLLSVKPRADVDHTITIEGTIDTNKDHGQMTNGIFAVGGTVDISGTSLPSPFVQVRSASSGSSNVTVEGNTSGWKAGDRVYLSGVGFTAYRAYAEAVDKSMRYITGDQGEYAEIASVSGSNIRLTNSLKYEHKYSIANVSRNVTIKSGSKDRGHIQLTGNVNAKVQYAHLSGLGRTRHDKPIDNVVRNSDGTPVRSGTNQLGRYAIHAHHVVHPFTFKGLVVDNTDPSLRWSIVQHSSYGFIHDNVVINPGEAGIAAETQFDIADWQRNLVIANGGGSAQNDSIFGTAYWSQTEQASIKSNRAEGIIGNSAYLIWPVSGSKVPSKLLDYDGVPSKYRGKKDSEDLPGLEFTSNKAFTFPALQAVGRAFAFVYGDWGLSIPQVKDFEGYGSVTAFYAGNILFDGLDLKSHKSIAENTLMGAFGNDYGPFGIYLTGVGTLQARNFSITGFNVGLTAIGLTTLKDGFMDNRVNIETYLIGDADCGCHISTSLSTDINNVRYGTTHSEININPEVISGIDSLAWRLGSRDEAVKRALGGFDTDKSPYYFYNQFLSPEPIKVTSYNGESGNNFEVFYKESAADYVIPGLNISNQDLYDGKGTDLYTKGLYGRSVGNFLVKDKKTKQGVNGYIGPLQGNERWAVTQAYDGKTLKAQFTDYSLQKDKPNAHFLKWTKWDFFDLVSNYNSKGLDRYGFNKIVIHRPYKYTIITGGNESAVSINPTIACSEDTNYAPVCSDGTRAKRDANRSCDFVCGDTVVPPASVPNPGAPIEPPLPSTPIIPIPQPTVDEPAPPVEIPNIPTPTPPTPAPIGKVCSPQGIRVKTSREENITYTLAPDAYKPNVQVAFELRLSNLTDGCTQQFDIIPEEIDSGFSIVNSWYPHVKDQPPVNALVTVPHNRPGYGNLMIMIPADAAEGTYKFVFGIHSKDRTVKATQTQYVTIKKPKTTTPVEAPKDTPVTTPTPTSAVPTPVPLPNPTPAQPVPTAPAPTPIPQPQENPSVSCTRTMPRLSSVPGRPHSSGDARGGNGTGYFSVQNKDSTGCDATTYILEPFTGPWPMTLDKSSITLKPGQMGEVSITYYIPTEEEKSDNNLRDIGMYVTHPALGQKIWIKFYVFQ